MVLTQNSAKQNSTFAAYIFQRENGNVSHCFHCRPSCSRFASAAAIIEIRAGPKRPSQKNHPLLKIPFHSPAAESCGGAGDDAIPTRRKRVARIGAAKAIHTA